MSRTRAHRTAPSRLLPGLATLALAALALGQGRGAPKTTGDAPPARGDDAAKQDDATRSEERAKPPKPLPTPEEWKALLARDARIAFTARTATDARALIAQGSATAEKRAAAWIALGSSGAIGERLVLEDLVKKGTGIERQAAVLALGEMSSGFEALFTSLVTGENEVAECALLALLRGGRAASQRRVEEIAHDAAHPLQKSAAALLVFQSDPMGSAPTPAAVLLLELRWSAARLFGLVDGRAWQVLLVQKLCEDEEFLREVVLRGSPRLYRPGVKDQLLEVLLSGSGDARLVAAVTAMPLEVQALVENDLWSPADAHEWSVILATIEQRALEPLTTPLLDRAAAIDALHYRAARLLARGGQTEIARLFDPDLSRLSVDDRVDAIDAMAISGDAGWRSRLEELEKSLDAPVRLAALAARMRLGARAAEDEVREALDDPEHADHAELLKVLLRTAHDPFVGNLLEDYLPRAKDDEALDVAIVLCAEGRITARSRVRKALAAEPTPHGDEALRLLRALARRPGAEDLELLRQLFPLEDRRDVEVELASALVELGDPAILPVLRASLWRSDVELSLLAGAVLAEIGGGIRALREELRVPPPEASSADLRRVGFAIGAWGGMREVEELSRELRYASGHPALQGALLGALTTRTQ